MGIARDGDHPGRGAGGQAAEQGGRQREVPEVVDPERQLKAVPGDAALAGDARIVDQHVQRFPQGQELLGAPRTDARSARSSGRNATASFPVAATISATARRPFSGERQAT